MRAIRFDSNPLITPASARSIGTNINGPSIISMPNWIEAPLGRYYCYFAHHHGDHIRLATADDVRGPWTVYEPGTLQLGQCPCVDHIASPDVHIDQKNKRLIMYYHGIVGSKDTRNHSGQRSYVATSTDGIHFESLSPVIGGFYFRVFFYNQTYFALAKSILSDGGGALWYGTDPLAPFTYSHELIPNMRHCAVNRRGDVLDVFFSRGLESPERIYHAHIDLTNDISQWQIEHECELLRPELEYEGAREALTASSFGWAPDPVNQLRDPGYFKDPADGCEYLFYSIAGEQGLAGAVLTRS